MSPSRERSKNPMSYEEKLAYQRGYAAGRHRKYALLWRIMEIAKAWRFKAVHGYGDARCDACRNWARHASETRWGKCLQDSWDSPDLGSAWAQSEDHKEANLITHENFACINWYPVKIIMAESTKATQQ